MTTTYTTHFDFPLLEAGSDGWDAVINGMFTDLDALLYQMPRFVAEGVSINLNAGAGTLTTLYTAPAGYKFVPYSSQAIQAHANGTQNLTGCVMFLNLSSGVHVGIVNVLQLVNTNGDGVISILQSGARFFIDRFEVVGWDIKNTPLHQTQLSSVAGFGCRQ